MQLAMINDQITPLAQVYELSTAKRDNPEGVSYVFKLGTTQFLPAVTEGHAEVFQQAKDFLEAVKAGDKGVDRDEEAGTNTEAAEEEF